MTDSHAIVSTLSGFGGLGLFLYGMALMSRGLQRAAGQRFRDWMRSISTNRGKGFSLGLTMGSAVQSSATTVMAVGLLNAGLLTLRGAIPVVAGANLGTTVSMQFIAFDISWLWAVLAISGCLLYFTNAKHDRRHVGRALLGLAMLFLGMRIMKEAVYPFRDTLSEWITHQNGHDWPAFMISLAGATFFTALIQSSGAAIGILFALAGAGVLTSIEQAFPLIIGAQIGTCITALLASTGTSADARRGALGHLLFNLITAVLSVAAMRYLLKAVDIPGITLTRQIATVFTLSKALGCIVVIPLTDQFTRLLRALTPFKADAQEESFLDYTLLDKPNLSIHAARNELGRMTRIIRRAFYLNRLQLKNPNRRVYNHIKQTEKDINNIYWATRKYLFRLTRNFENGEYAGRVQWLNLCLNYLERIGDHNDNLSDLMFEFKKRITPKDREFTYSLCDALLDATEPILADIQESWSGHEYQGADYAGTIKVHRTDYLAVSDEQQSRLIQSISDGTITPVTGFVLTEYISEMDRIVRHAKKIAGILKKTSAAVP